MLTHATIPKCELQQTTKDSPSPFTVFPLATSLLKSPVYSTPSSSGGLQDSTMMFMSRNPKYSEEALTADFVGVWFSRTPLPPHRQHNLLLHGRHPRLRGRILPLATVRCDSREAGDRAPVRGDVPSIGGSGYRMSYRETLAPRLRALT